MTIAEPSTDLVYEQERAAGWVREDLDFEYIDGAGADVAATLAHGQAAELAYQPGDGTFYGLVFVPLRSLVPGRARVVKGQTWELRAIRGMGQREGEEYVYDATGYLVAWVEHAAYPIRLGGRAERSIAATYIAEHWNTSPVSGCSLAILFRAVSHYLDHWAEVGRGT